MIPRYAPTAPFCMRTHARPRRHAARAPRPHASPLRRDLPQVTAGALAELLTATGAAAGDPAQLPAAAASAEPLTIDAVRRVRAGALENVRVPQHVIDLLVDLRTFLQDALEPPTYVSDRRMVKAVQLMKVRAPVDPNACFRLLAAVCRPERGARANFCSAACRG